jgi:hypothetical protein
MPPDWFSRLFSIDERFVMHRYLSTRWSVMVGVILMALWVNFEYFVNQTLRMDLVIILLAMAITKLAVMVYLQRTH